MKIIFIALFAVNLQANAQIVINYETWTGATGCNSFSVATNVPATINGSSTTLSHLSTVGQPQYGTTNNDIDLAGNTSSTGGYIGTEYRIAYNFKQGYSYAITINTRSISNSGAFPYLRLRLGNTTGSSPSCNGPQTIDQATTGNLTQSVPINSGNFNNVSYNFPVISSAAAYITVANVPILNNGLQTIQIRKITITETASTPTFTLSPTSVTKTCGTALSQTFTANSSNMPQGATVSYLWNLGSSGNGWLYNGTAAPATITTTTNTLALTASTCDIKPANITVTATVNGTNYSAGTASVTLAPFSISGPAYFCGSSAAYSIANLGCSATITWSVSNSNVQLSCTSCNQTTLTKVTNGPVTLTASISNACGVSTTITKNITVGAPPITFTSNNNYPCSGTYQTWLLSIDTPANGSNWYWYVDYLSEGGDVYIDNPYGSFTYIDVSGTAGIRLSYTDLCGVAKQDGVTVYSYCSEYSFTLSPNPARETVTVKTNKQTLAKNSSPDLIYAIMITDRFGNIQKSVQYKPGVESTKISLSGLKAGMYILSVFNNKRWSSQTLIIPD